MSPDHSLINVNNTNNEDSSPSMSAPAQRRSATPVTVTHFTDRGKIERVPMSLIELDDLTPSTPKTPPVNINNNPFISTNPFYQVTESKPNPFLNPFTEVDTQNHVESTHHDKQNGDEIDGNANTNKVCVVFFCLGLLCMLLLIIYI